jgi:hypothetical protein
MGKLQENSAIGVPGRLERGKAWRKSLARRIGGGRQQAGAVGSCTCCTGLLFGDLVLWRLLGEIRSGSD